MNKLIVFILLSITITSYTQDFLFVGKVFILPEIRRSICSPGLKDLGASYIENETGSKYDSIAQFLKSNKNLRFEIRSHTDGRGSDLNNLKLSQFRADEWRVQLMLRGVDSLQINAIGFGESNPRTVWIADSIYYTEQQKGVISKQLILSEAYINEFRKMDLKTFNLLHSLNRRDELVIIEIID